MVAVAMTEFKKFDTGKAPLHLLPHEALTGAAHALGYGAAKYGDWNWRLGTEWNRYYDAVLRHMLAWQSGEDMDPESGLPHLDHALATLMMLAALVKTNVGKDDRYKCEQ
jgi:hypothetical protein